MHRLDCFLGFALILPPIAAFASGAPQDAAQKGVVPKISAVPAREKQVPFTKEEEARIEHDPFIAELVKSLRSHDVKTRIDAIESFSSFYDEARYLREFCDARDLVPAARALAEALRDEDQSVRLAAAKALEVMGPAPGRLAGRVERRNPRPDREPLVCNRAGGPPHPAVAASGAGK